MSDLKTPRSPASGLKGCAPFILALTVITNLPMAGCHKATEPLPDVVVEHEIEPQPPRVGQATVTLNLSDSRRMPLKGVRVTLEGNMSHAGMQPVFSDATELEPGRYQAPLEFTMAGDWIILIHVTMPDGHKLERQIEISSVQPG